MTSTTLDIQELALKLAGATKPCPACNEGEVWVPVPCYVCATEGNEGTGEVYVLGPEVRVGCVCLSYPSRHKVYECLGRGWNPLGPRLLGEWMVALAKAGHHIEVQADKDHGSVARIVGVVGTLPHFYADTPEPAFLKAATHAITVEGE